MTANKKIPALRFKEFEGDWVNTRLLEIANKVTDGTHDTPNKIEEGVPFITAIHVRDGNICFNACYYVSEKDHKEIYKRCNPERDDLLMVNIGAGTATCAIVNVDYEFSLKNVALIKPNKEKINAFYLVHYQRRKTNKLFNQLTSGGAQPFLSLKEIGKLKVEYPSLPEQQKIASFLTAVDDKIQQLRKKKALLEQYKKGVMQQIFNQQIRFKDDDGNDYLDWEEKKLEAIATFSKGKNIAKSDIAADGKIECIRYGELYTEYREVIKEIISRTNLDKDKLIFSQHNDVIIPASGETQLDIATASCILKDNVAIGGDVNIIKSKLNGVFLSYYLNNVKKMEIAKLAQGNAVVHLYANQLKAISISILEKEEQQKIANFLTGIDNKINAVGRQLEQTQVYKKGLLQQMFV